MDFVLWVCRVVHIVSVIVWLGGLIYFNAVMRPIAEHRQATRTTLTVEILRRFQSFIWSSFWPLLFTGLLLMLLSPRFVWFDFSTSWARLLAVKQFALLVLLFFAWQMGRVVQKLQEEIEGEEFHGWWMTYSKLVKRSILAGIVALLSAGGMMVV